MATKKQLEEALLKFVKQFPGARMHVNGEGYSVIGNVISPSFAGQDEADRQEAIWKYLREELGQDELQNIEFVFTDTPEEVAAYMKEAEASS